MVKLRITDFYGIQANLIDDDNFALPIIVENKLNINALKNDGYGYIFNLIPMVTNLAVKVSINLLKKERFVSQAKETSEGNPFFLYFAENGLRIIIEEEIIDLIEKSILDWDKLLILYGVE